jgi:hypothetical protein
MRRRVRFIILSLLVAGVHVATFTLSLGTLIVFALVPEGQPPSPWIIAAVLILAYPLLPLVRHLPWVALSKATGAMFYAVVTANALIWGFAIVWVVGRVIRHSRSAGISN